MIVKNTFSLKIFAVAALLLTGALVLSSLPMGAQSAPASAESVKERPLRSLADLNQAFIDIAAEVKPTVVTVSTERLLSYRQTSPFGNDPFEFFFGPRGRQQQAPEQEYRQTGLGSGVIVSGDGRILTNNHVVDKADSIFVRTFDGRRYTASVIGVDPKTDIAVLDIDGEDFDYLTIGNSDDLQVGELVIAVGSPMSENLAYTVTQGIVSAKGRSNVGLTDYENFIQTDAAINPGNSGGPLVNLDGELIGLNTAIASRSGGFQGIGFAVPSNMARQVMNSLVTDGRVVRGWLGVSIQDVNEDIARALKLKETHGALVGDVLADSPAERAGFESGDVIVTMNGDVISNSAQLRNRVAASPPETEVKFEVNREGDRQNLTVKLGELPSDAALAGGTGDLNDLLGFAVSSLDREATERYSLDGRAKGVIVTEVESGSAAARAGLREGDLILSIDRTLVGSVADFSELTSGKERGDSILLRIQREGSGFFVAFTL